MAESIPTPQGAQQQPFGQTPAVGPTENRGYQAAGLQRLGMIVKQLEECIPMFGAATDEGKACLDALQKLVKLVPSGSVNPAAERSNIEQMAMRNVESNQQMQALRQQQSQRPGMGAQPGQAAA